MSEIPDWVIRGATPEVKATMEARHAVVEEYLRQKGISTVEELSIDQILEIRANPGWAKPLGEATPETSVVLEIT